MANYLNPFSGRQFIDASGTPYSGAKLFIYQAGTSTKITTYKDSAGASSHTNPIVLNSKGEPADGAGASQPIWQSSLYAAKLVLAPANDTDPPASAISTWDNISGINNFGDMIDQRSDTGAVEFTLHEYNENRTIDVVVDFDADPTGVSSSVSAFQAAIDSLPSTGVHKIHIPSGTYLGDMSTLTYGSRTIIWEEDNHVAYTTAFPSQTRSETRSLPPVLFSQSINPSKHLRQFSSRKASAGSGCVVGAVTIGAGAITDIAVTAGGSNYKNPRVIITGDGTGATATATIAGNSVSAFVVTAGGSGYTTATVYVVEGPIVVLTGDSIATEAPTPVVSSETLWTLITRSISEQNPGRNTTFFNRAVGSQTWTTLYGVANSNWPTWYSNQSKAWLDYIEELQPDLVIVALGMNDRQNFVVSRIKSVMTKLAAFSPAPDVVLATTMVPSAISADTAMSSSESQIGRDLVSGYTRGYALANGHGLLDFNRQLRLVRDGIDVRQSALRAITVSGTQAFPWTATSQCADFYLKATFAAIPAGWWTARTIEILASPEGVNSINYIRVVDSTGYIKTTFYDYTVSPPAYTSQLSITSTFATPTSGDVELEIIVHDQLVQVIVNGTTVFNRIVARMGGVFYPEIVSSGASATIKFAAGEYTQFPSRLTDYELWGYNSSTYFAGNAKNHPTSLCTKHVIAPVVHNSDWDSTPISFDQNPNSSSTFVGVNEPNPVAVLHITNTPYSATLTPSSDSATLLVEDNLNPGISLLGGSTGAGRIQFGDEGSSTQCTISYAHSTDVFSFNLGGTTQLHISNAGGVNIGNPAGYKGTGSLNISGTYYVDGTQVVSNQETGWTAGTGTANKAAFATYAGQNVSAGYVEAEAQATDDAVKANSQRIKAIEDALRTHGLIN